MRTVEKYEALCKSSKKQKLPVDSLPEYINAIMAIQRLYKKVFYRGQADAAWEIESSAYRLLHSPMQKQLGDYHAKLVGEVRLLTDMEKK